MGYAKNISLIIGLFALSGLIMLPSVLEEAYAPGKDKTSFNFKGKINGGAGMNMQGAGTYDESSIKANGGFKQSMGGHWSAVQLDPDMDCEIFTQLSVCPIESGNSVVVFAAEFSSVTGSFTKIVIVADSDIDLTDKLAGIQNFMIEGKGFGTAKVKFH